MSPQDWNKLHEKVEKMSTLLSNLNRRLNRLKREAGGLNKRMSRLTRRIPDIENSRTDLQQECGDLLKKINETKASLGDQRIRLSICKIQYQIDGTAYTSKEELTDFDKSVRESRMILMQYKENYQKGLDEIRALNNDLEELNSDIKDTRISLKKVEKTISSVSREIKDMNRHMDKEMLRTMTVIELTELGKYTLMAVEYKVAYPNQLTVAVNRIYYSREKASKNWYRLRERAGTDPDTLIKNSNKKEELEKLYKEKISL